MHLGLDRGHTRWHRVLRREAILALVCVARTRAGRGDERSSTVAKTHPADRLIGLARAEVKAGDAADSVEVCALHAALSAAGAGEGVASRRGQKEHKNRCQQKEAAVHVLVFLIWFEL